MGVTSPRGKRQLGIHEIRRKKMHREKNHRARADSAAGARSPPAGKSIPSPDGSHKPAMGARVQLACVVPLLIVVDADPISACKGTSAARWVELGDPDPPPAENLRSPSRPRHVIFFPRCIFTPALLPGAYARSRLRHLSAVVVGLCSRCSLTACRCRGRPAAATSGAR